jgi:tetratricopeptide (TPR) repeat protein
LTLLASGTPEVERLLQLVRERPAFEAARMAAASSLIDAGRGGDAVGVLEQAAGAPDASPQLLERLAAAWLSAGDPRRTVEVLAPVVAAAASADAWNLEGVARAQLGERNLARRALDTAVALAPSAARYRFNRALVRLEDGDPAGALDDAGQAIALAPELTDAWRLRATLRYERGERDAAIEAWQRVVRLDPADSDSLFNLATALAAAGNQPAARDAAARYLALPARPGSERDVASMRSIATRR